MAVTGSEIQSVNLFEITDDPEGLGSEGRLALEGVQHDAFASPFSTLRSRFYRNLGRSEKLTVIGGWQT